MSTESGERQWVMINRAPVLTVWAAVVAEHLGFRREEALTLGRAVAGLNAYAKGKSLGIFQPSKKAVAEERKRLGKGGTATVDLLRRAVPVTKTPEGLRALSRDKPIDPAGVDRYLRGKFGDALEDARRAMTALARAHPPAELAEHAYELYEAFRPQIPGGKRGAGALRVACRWRTSEGWQRAAAPAESRPDRPLNRLSRREHVVLAQTVPTEFPLSATSRHSPDMARCLKSRRRSCPCFVDTLELA